MRSEDTFDTLIKGADLESANSEEEGSDDSLEDPETPSEPLTLEEENKLLRSQVQELRSELAYWKGKCNDGGTPTKQVGLWENTMNGLRQFVSTPQPDNLNEKESFGTMSLDSPSGGSVEFTRTATGLHHRKSGTASYFERLSPFRISQEEAVPSETNTLSQQEEEGVSLVKSHSSDREDQSSIDSQEEGGASFYYSLVDRGAWLVGLLVLQSFSSFIIQRNEMLLQRHTVIVRFLTMLVGAGGNAGNQASVRVIRGLATGKIDEANVKPYLMREMQAGFFLSVVLGVAGCVRAAVFLTPPAETLAITTSLVMIVASSIFLGTGLPLLMKYLKIDPAHSSTTIQVIMDILGVAITVYISSLVLDHAMGRGDNSD